MLWWSRLQDRFGHAGIVWSGEPEADDAVPQSLFDSVLENLLQNALAKRLHQPGLEIAVRLGDGGLTVADNGSPVAPEIVDALFREPVTSEDGLGIGLYHAARQAEAAGYCLALTTNRPGRVVFSLSVRH
jgi:signal transduction histidine kinase